MAISETESRKMLPHLRDWLGRVIVEIGQHLEISDWRNRDDLAFMGICFLSKQLCHAESLVMIVPRKDSTLIARTMAEGLAQFLWASKEPESRPNAWRAYAVIEDYRSIPRLESRGCSPTPEMIRSIEKEMAEVGPMFYTDKAMKAVEAGRPLPERPHYDSWRKKVSIRKIFEEIKGSDIYSFFYGPFSTWAHWSSKAFADRFDEETPSSTRWTPIAYSMAAASIVLGITTVLQTAEILFDHLGHPAAHLPGDLRGEFEAWHKAEFDRIRSKS
jgi:hypothetical protein